ncbi:hypothetical protein QFZ61_001919 [Arthrobacter sp. B3I4]|nr:hypothetical protein [Arthrobacter sp. B3I4]
MRTGAGLAVVAVLLVLMSPLIISNFGTATFVGAAPVAILVTTFYLLAPAVCIIFSAVLIAASLIMRHAEALKTDSLTPRYTRG